MVIPRIDISGDQTMEDPLLIFTGSHQSLDYQRASPRSEPRSQPLGPQVQQRRGHGRGLRHGREEMLPARCRGCSSQISKTASSKQLKNWECHLQTQLKHGGITANWIYKQLALGILSFSLWPFLGRLFWPVPVYSPLIKHGNMESPKNIQKQGSQWECHLCFDHFRVRLPEARNQ